MLAVSKCALRVASFVWRPHPEAWTLTIVCKATYRLVPGVATLAERQLEPAELDAHWDNDPRRSVRAPADFAPFKSGADVVLVGSAFAPNARQVRSLTARLAVGHLDKTIEVVADRAFAPDGSLVEGAPFSRMPLGYEHAAGGPGTSNPVGMRLDARDAQGAVRVPNVQSPGARVARRGEIFAPAGFGPIAPTWPERAAKARPGFEWTLTDWRERPLPDETDPALFNVAPEDQRLDAIRADEAIVLENLHPAHPRVEMRLPGMRPRALMKTGGPGGDEIDLVADTLWIDTDAQIATVTYRGSVALSHPGEPGTIEVDLVEATAADAELGEGDEDDASTMRVDRDDQKTLTGAVVPDRVLPFKAGVSPWVGYKPPARDAALREDSGTVLGGKASARDVLPFAWNVPHPQREAPPVIVEAPPRAPGKTAVVLEEASTQDERTADVPPGAADPVAAIAAPPEEPGELPLDRFPIERCAAIAASIARTPADEAKTLESNDVDAATWARLERHYGDLLMAEASRSKVKLMQAYDDAYVARLEEERGPISVDEYARLTVAAERGNAADTLAELGLPAKARMRIERVWLRRIVSDPKVGKSVGRAVKAAREG